MFSFCTIYVLRQNDVSEPHNEEQKLSKERLDSWISHFGMNKFQSHCSGYARGRDEVVKEIDAKMLFLVHTEHPDVYKKSFKRFDHEREIQNL